MRSVTRSFRRMVVGGALALVAAGVLALNASAATTNLTVQAQGTGTFGTPGYTFATDTGVTLEAGQTAIVMATGVWDACGGACPSGPDGVGGPGNPGFIHPWSSAGTLVGSLDGGATWFAIGSGPTIVTGPGTLLLATNDFDGGHYDELGSLDVTILHASNADYHMSPYAGWDGIGEDTGVVLAGETVSITASGSINCGGPGCDFGPDGLGYTIWDMLDPSSSALGLIARVGTTGPWTFIGSGPVEISGTGTLYVAHNDSYYWDNYGEGFDIWIDPVVAPDTTPPLVTASGPVVAEATGPAGAVVTYAAATATDDVDGSVAATCAPASGSVFPIGATTVTCTASDAAGNLGSATFTVTVADTAAPTVSAALVNVKKGGDDDSTQTFRVVISGGDAVGVASLTATLNGITVTNGQIVKLKIAKKGPQKATWSDGVLHLQATAFALTVSATDAAGNAASATAVPVFNKNGKGNG